MSSAEVLDVVKSALKANPSILEDVAKEDAPARVVNAQDVALFVFNSLKKTEGMKSVFGQMRTDDFINLRGFGLNRDVKKRIEGKTSAKNTHLKGELTSAQQYNVAVVVTSEKSGEFYDSKNPIMKIDGHSRCAAWEAEALTKPEMLNVQFFFDLDDSDIIREYKVFTNSLAQATTAEQNQIDNKLNHYMPESKFCQASWKDAFKKLDDLSYEDGLKKYGSLLLRIVDKWAVTPEIGKASTKRHSTGVKMAILHTYDSDDYTDWENFWKDFFAAESEIKQCKALREQVKGLGTHAPVPVQNACVKAFTAYEKAKAKA